jgi:hypothetical protein
MAITENRYTGDGSTVLYSFTFPYFKVADIKVSLDDALTTEYTLANATTVQFNTAPADGAAIRIFRTTDSDELLATFFPGSAIRAQDLNDNFNQNLFVTQESTRDSGDATDIAKLALTTSNTALSTANTALTNANTAVSIANDAASDAAAAVVTANAADAKADTAITTSNAADLKAQQALNAVGNALLYTVVSDVAAIPVAPENNDAVEVFDSTGIEAFTPLTNIPVGFVGDSGLSVRIVYNESGSTWNWIQYFANDSELRYVATADIGVTVQPYDATILNDADIGVTVQPYDATYLVDADIDVTVQSYDADTVKQDVLPTFTTATRTTERTITAGTFDISTGNLWTVGAITVPNPTNAVSGQTGAIRITAGPVVWSGNFKFPGGTPPTIATFPAIIPFYVQDASTILMGNVVEGIA